ncbi:hypothetical protein MXD81_25995, partial [Microbacteriaceae bacterium K1510]|nr:hypothetical protein [Microbacteriaceae bacterium K1510]
RAVLQWRTPETCQAIRPSFTAASRRWLGDLPGLAPPGRKIAARRRAKGNKKGSGAALFQSGSAADMTGAMQSDEPILV